MNNWAIILPIASGLLIYGLRMAELGTKREIVPGPVRETATLRLFILAGALMLAGAIVEFLWRGGTWHGPAFLAGWVLALASIALRRRAIAALGHFWSLHVEIRPNHQFVRSGPFRWLRHPTYLSMFLELFAGALFLNAPGALAISLLIFVPTLLWRLRLEEAALVEKFGDAYRAYQSNTPALFPYKWPTIK